MKKNIFWLELDMGPDFGTLLFLKSLMTV